MLKLLAIDPGSKISGYVLFRIPQFKLISAGDISNSKLRTHLSGSKIADYLAVERPALLGQKFMQQDVVDSIFECGRFVEAFDCDERLIQLTRSDVLNILFGLRPKNADTQVKELLRNTYGEVGTLKNPGPLIKLRGKKHAWQALGCGLAVLTPSQYEGNNTNVAVKLQNYCKKGKR